MIVPASMAFAIVKPDDPRLSVSGGLGSAPMARWIYRKGSQQQQQHGSHCHLPVVMQADHRCHSTHDTYTYGVVLLE
jgi:hypothetical protein